MGLGDDRDHAVRSRRAEADLAREVPGLDVPGELARRDVGTGVVLAAPPAPDRLNVVGSAGELVSANAVAGATSNASVAATITGFFTMTLRETFRHQ